MRSLKTWFYLFIFLQFCVLKVYSDCDNVITDFGPSDCDESKNEYYEENLDGESCIPRCIEKYTEGESCYEFPSDPESHKPCAPGLQCVDNNCVLDEASCAKFQYATDKPKWLPKCLPDGSFAPKQCKGETQNGRCYCYDSTGNRIFGEEWSNQAENMTCACSRRRSELEKNGRTDVTLHCDSLGNYEPLQCDSGSCWCADPKTGDVLESVVPEAMMTVLSCYDRSKVGDQYLRQCESQAIAQAKIRTELKIHGTIEVNLPFIVCDWDGSYGRYRAEKGLLYCTWRDNSNVGSWADMQSNAKTMNCNCARDTKIYALAGKTLTKQCMGNGNYEKRQQFEDKYYCVDNDGFAINDADAELTPEDCEELLKDTNLVW